MTKFNPNSEQNARRGLRVSAGLYKWNLMSALRDQRASADLDKRYLKNACQCPWATARFNIAVSI